MVQRYFQNFPTEKYGNTSIVDITKRVVLLDSVSNNPYAFYPYELDVHERADQFSHRYYKDPFQSWIIYFSNKIVDPYYEWYLSETEFNDYLDKKYGSVYAAQSKIKMYQNNWIGQENISASEYNALPPKRKDYWEPIIGASNAITSYKRKQTDWTTNTNKIMSYTVSNTSFITDEVVDIVYDVNTVGKGQILSINQNTVYVQHVSGTYDETGGYLYGTESNVNTPFTSVTTIVDNILPDEEVYWKAVTYYDYETARNEYNKTIRVLDNRYSGLAIQNIKTLLSK